MGHSVSESKISEQDLPVRVQRLIRVSRRAWPLLIDLWILGVLVSFFIIRIIHSNLGQHVITAVRGRLS